MQSVSGARSIGLYQTSCSSSRISSYVSGKGNLITMHNMHPLESSPIDDKHGQEVHYMNEVEHRSTEYYSQR